MDIDVIVSPYDSGARGYRMGAGPERLIALGLVHRLEAAGHGVRQVPVQVPDHPLQAEVATAFALNRQIADRVREACRAERFPVVLSGNCIAAVGAVAGMNGATGVFWFDRHGDFNTPETTTGGFLDGMALATLAGRCWRRLAGAVPGFAPVPEEDMVLLGTRDLDPPERALLADSGVVVLDPSRLAGELPDLAEEIAVRVRQSYVHLDLDVMDAQDGRANHFAGDNGVDKSDLQAILADLCGRLPVGVVTLSAYDPEADPDGRAGAAALDFLEGILGQIGSR